MLVDKNRTKIVVVSVLALAALLSSASFRGGALLSPGTTTTVRDGGSWTRTSSRVDDDDDDGDGDDDGWGDDGVPNAYDGGFLDDDEDDEDDEENTNDDRDGIADHDEGDSLSETTRSARGPDNDNLAGGGTDDDEPRPKNNERRRRRRRGVTKGSLPIYLLDTTANRTAVISWGELAGKWDRATRYEDLFGMAKMIPSLPPASSTTSTSKRKKRTSTRRRTVVMIHCGPKTGSTTLRAACRANLHETCGVESSTGRKWFAPPGYMDESVLYPLIRRCVNTTHFCVKDVDMPIDVPAFRDDVALFVHMFPFRDYDGWTASAMKQQYDRGGTKACERTRILLERCEHNNMEIDFRKYGKAGLSVFKDEVVRRMNRMDESHVFLLYHHLELSDVLGWLSVEYDVPSLPRTDERKKGKRPEGTCDPALLEMFHDCFSSELTKLK